MSEEKKVPEPEKTPVETDDTSALFVTARKKQLEEQEAKRQEEEREAKRKAAEAEVRRLEAELAERKRKAEEEARRMAASGSASPMPNRTFQPAKGAVPPAGRPVRQAGKTGTQRTAPKLNAAPLIVMAVVFGLMVISGAVLLYIIMTVSGQSLLYNDWIEPMTISVDGYQLLSAAERKDVIDRMGDVFEVMTDAEKPKFEEADAFLTGIQSSDRYSAMQSVYGEMMGNTDGYRLIYGEPEWVGDDPSACMQITAEEFMKSSVLYKMGAVNLMMSVLDTIDGTSGSFMEAEISCAAALTGEIEEEGLEDSQVPGEVFDLFCAIYGYNGSQLRGQYSYILQNGGYPRYHISTSDAFLEPGVSTFYDEVRGIQFEYDNSMELRSGYTGKSEEIAFLRYGNSYMFIFDITDSYAARSPGMDAYSFVNLCMDEVIAGYCSQLYGSCLEYVVNMENSDPESRKTSAHITTEIGQMYCFASFGIPRNSDVRTLFVIFRDPDNIRHRDIWSNVIKSIQSMY